MPDTIDANAVGSRAVATYHAVPLPKRLRVIAGEPATGPSTKATSTEAVVGRTRSVQIVAVEPSDSPILTKGHPGPHKIQGIGPNFVPAILDRDLIDEVIDVEFDDAIRLARDTATKDGILVGMSSGAAIWAALEIAKRPEAAGKNIVVIIPSFGERYLSTALYENLRED